MQDQNKDPSKKISFFKRMLSYISNFFKRRTEQTQSTNTSIENQEALQNQGQSINEIKKETYIKDSTPRIGQYTRYNEEWEKKVKSDRNPYRYKDDYSGHDYLKAKKKLIRVTKQIDDVCKTSTASIYKDYERYPNFTTTYNIQRISRKSISELLQDTSETCQHNSSSRWNVRDQKGSSMEI